MIPSEITFGDKVRVTATDSTENLGIAGLTGVVHGSTTPSITGIALAVLSAACRARSILGSVGVPERMEAIASRNSEMKRLTPESHYSYVSFQRLTETEICLRWWFRYEVRMNRTPYLGPNTSPRSSS
jgi:hypothetical protein